MNVKTNLKKVLVGCSRAAMLFSVPVISNAAPKAEGVSEFTTISQDVLKEAQKNPISIDKNTINLEDTSLLDKKLKS